MKSFDDVLKEAVNRKRNQERRAKGLPELDVSEEIDFSEERNRLSINILSEKVGDIIGTMKKSTAVGIMTELAVNAGLTALTSSSPSANSPSDR